jgi:hypothetical protein
MDFDPEPINPALNNSKIFTRWFFCRSLIFSAILYCSSHSLPSDIAGSTISVWRGSCVAFGSEQ